VVDEPEFSERDDEVMLTRDNLDDTHMSRENR